MFFKKIKNEDINFPKDYLINEPEKSKVYKIIYNQ